MTDARTVVITGASRGLGLASATRLYRDGWRVVAAMRTPELGMSALRDATGAGPDDDRLVPVTLDLTDRGSIALAAKTIVEDVGVPYAVVHNAGISAAGMVEESPIDLWDRMFQTHVTGPVQLTQALLPAMRAAGRGRFVMVSSQSGVRGMPAVAAYSASKGALERWAEALAGEVSPFGLGVTVLVTGTYDTDIITDAGTTDLRNFDGPYARLHANIDGRGRMAMRMASPPARFAHGLAKALEDEAPYAKHAVGPDAIMLVASSRLLPQAAMHQMCRLAMGLPKQGALAPGALTLGQRAMIRAATTLPPPVLQRIVALVARFQRPPPTPSPTTPESPDA